MATTTNFGWETPDDTDLVKDGAAAIRTLGSAIDSSMQYLEGGTTGQILSKTSATDMAFTWVTSAGDIEGVTAGTGISGGGTSGTVTITNSMATEIDAKGDLIGGTGADTFARLAIGTNNQVLTADSAEATGLKWATPTGSNDTFALLNSGGTTLTGATTVTYTLGATYNQLFIFIAGASSASAGSQIRVRINGDTSTYYEFGQTITQSATYSADFLGSFSALTSTGILLGTLSTDAASTLSGYVAISSAGTTGSKVYLGGAGVSRATGDDNKAYIVGGVAPTASAISTVSVVSSTGNLDAGTLYVYGG